jgi:hypothetical protein
MLKDLNDIVDSDLAQTAINRFFPKNTQSCHNYYGGDCTFVSTCHSNQTIEEGLETGFYKKREPHHELELEEFKEKGFLD